MSDRLTVTLAGLLFAALHYIAPAHGAGLEASGPPQRPYSCQLYGPN